MRRAHYGRKLLQVKKYVIRHYLKNDLEISKKH